MPGLILGNSEGRHRAARLNTLRILQECDDILRAVWRRASDEGAILPELETRRVMTAGTVNARDVVATSALVGEDEFGAAIRVAAVDLNPLRLISLARGQNDRKENDDSENGASANVLD